MWVVLIHDKSRLVIICCSSISIRRAKCRSSICHFCLCFGLFVLQSQQLVLSSVHWSVSPTFLPNLLSLWRITGSREMNPDSTAGDERQTFIFVFIGVISPWHTPIVTLSVPFCFLLTLFYLLLLLLRCCPLVDWLKQIITSAAWCPEPEDSITVANDLVVAISLPARRARSFLLLTLAGKAQCYPSRFLCWPLPLILILLSVSVQSFKGAESLSTSRTLWHTDITSGLTVMEWEPKTRQGALVPCAPSLLSFSSCPQLVWKKSTTAALNSEYNLCFALAGKSCGVWMYAYLHVCWFI